MRKARIENNRVCEILDAEPFPPFAPELIWVECGPGVNVGDVYASGAFTAYVPPPPPAPSRVSMRQARLALLSAGLLAQVDAAIAAMTGTEGEAARIEWEYATEVRRNSALVQSLTPVLNMDEAALDALFTTAAAL